MELYPIVSNSQILFFAGMAPDFLLTYNHRTHHVRTFLLTNTGRAIEISSLLNNGLIRIANKSLGISVICNAVKPLPNRVWIDINDAVKDVLSYADRILRGRHVIMCFSGGKDSSVALAILSALMNYIDFRLHVIYVYVPFLDDVKGPAIAASLAKRLGLDVEVIEPKRRDVKSYLRWLGLPKLGNRWCTKFKVIPVKRLAKELNGIIIVADRAIESPKRCRKLLFTMYSRPREGVRKLYLISKATLLDVIEISKSLSLVHPLYFKGVTRVSCALCPFKSLYEYAISFNEQIVEDPGFIDSILRNEYRKEYARYVDENSFKELMLWRFNPLRAKLLAKLHEFVERYLIEERSITYEELSAWFSSPWRQGVQPEGLGISNVRDLCSILSL